MQRASIRIVIALLVFAGAVLMMVDVTAEETAARAADELLEMHEKLIESHLKGDVEELLALEPEQTIVAQWGEVRHEDKKDRHARFKQYLESTEFTEYRDLIDPIVHVSGDGTLGWLIAQVKISGSHKDTEGNRTPFETIWAWIELYEKHDGRWIRIGEVSNLKPEDP